MDAPAFEEFPKIARLSRLCVVTEKIDGTNGQIHILEDGTVLAGSRSRYVSPQVGDNFGFGWWVAEHANELRDTLGPGRHFGEWWGLGIQRGYGLTEKRFSLFNTARWNNDTKPACCSVVPVLYQGIFDTASVMAALDDLRANGSQAAPGFLKPEGVVIWHEAARCGFKKTIERDEAPKGKADV